jgi:selenide,water dikinase
LPKRKDPNLLVGYETHDDAGIYRLSDEIAIITTADYITPPVNDPFVFGQVAAANALSDVYAMGGRPVTCLNLVGFPSKKLEPDVLNQIVAGGLSKITEAGAVLAGGHTIDDDEPKYGLAVTGVVHPGKYWTNSGAQPGDRLILTKPIGSGVIFNANLKNWVSAAALAECLAIITELNKTAAEILERFDVHAATDITGFGLAGHAYEMAAASGVCLQLEIDRVPIMDEALAMYERGMSTGVNRSIRQLVETHMRFDRDLPPWHREIIMDPQTNGGLLVAVGESRATELIEALQKAGVSAASIVGRVDRLAGPVYLAVE